VSSLSDYIYLRNDNERNWMKASVDEESSGSFGRQGFQRIFQRDETSNSESSLLFSQPLSLSWLLNLVLFYFKRHLPSFTEQGFASAVRVLIWRNSDFRVQS